LVNDSILINDISHLEEQLALRAINDTKHNNYIRKQIAFERNRLIAKLDAKDIKYYNSNVNYILLDTNYNKNKIVDELEKDNIILYESMDTYNNFWTLPIANKELNNRVFQAITFED
jgi:histidinol-phosphate/aromatic aminotransferase/cobyric acid decarboxylase-like protein